MTTCKTPGGKAGDEECARWNAGGCRQRERFVQGTLAWKAAINEASLIDG